MSIRSPNGEPSRMKPTRIAVVAAEIDKWTQVWEQNFHLGETCSMHLLSPICACVNHLVTNMAPAWHRAIYVSSDRRYSNTDEANSINRCGSRIRERLLELRRRVDIVSDTYSAFLIGGSFQAKSESKDPIFPHSDVYRGIWRGRRLSGLLPSNQEAFSPKVVDYEEERFGRARIRRVRERGNKTCKFCCFRQNSSKEGVWCTWSPLENEWQPRREWHKIRA